MIVAAGLSPAWQQVLVVDGLQPGGVNRCREAYWCASGKVLNAGLAIHHLSGGRTGESLSLTVLGGAAYEAIDREFELLGASRRWVRTAAPTRVCTTIVDRGSATATELVENAGPLTAGELAEFIEALVEEAARAEAVVITGSVPAGVSPDVYGRLLERIDVAVVLDIRGAELLAALAARPLVVKPNREELAATLGAAISSDDELRRAMDELERRGAQRVVVTSGDGPVWIGGGGDFQKLDPPRVDRVVNPIGCGDALAGAIAWHMAQGADVPTAVERGLELAAANLRTLLPSDFDGRRAALSRR